MKMDHLIEEHLFSAKKVSIEDIGTFLLSEGITDATDRASLPDNAISFLYNPKTPRDEALVNYIMQKTKKIKPLATSDLESYSLLAKEYLNIGKPFVIEGIGTLQKSKNAELEFIQGLPVASKIEVSVQGKESTGIDFSTAPRKKKIISKGIMALIVAFTIITFTTVLYFSNKNNSSKIQVIKNDKDSSTTNVISTSPNGISRDSLSSDTIFNKGINVLRFVISTHKSQSSAQRALMALPDLQLYELDSVYYLITKVLATQVTDTTHLIDSLKIKYGSTIYLLPPQP